MKIDLAIEFAHKKFFAVGLTGEHFMRTFMIMKDEYHIEDSEVLEAGILHDTLENSDTTYEELEQVFSRRVADMVQEVSHPKNYNKEQKEEYYKSLHNISPEAKLIKLADFTDHLRSLLIERKAAPEAPYHNGYILKIHDFLTSCPDSDAKTQTSNLATELEKFVTI